jgi:hypothetical protein
MYFRYAKIQPYLKQFRKVMRLPEWMENLEGVVEGSAKGRARIARMQESIQAVAESKT